MWNRIDRLCRSGGAFSVVKCAAFAEENITRDIRAKCLFILHEAIDKVDGQGRRMSCGPGLSVRVLKPFHLFTKAVLGKENAEYVRAAHEAVHGLFIPVARFLTGVEADKAGMPAAVGQDALQHGLHALRRKHCLL